MITYHYIPCIILLNTFLVSNKSSSTDLLFESIGSPTLILISPGFIVHLFIGFILNKPFVVIGRIFAFFNIKLFSFQEKINF